MRSTDVMTDASSVTILGNIPEGWIAATMEDVAEVVGGGTPDAKEPLNFTEEGGHAWITPADLSGITQMFISRGRRNLTPRGLSASSARLMPKGTVLMSSRAPIGYLAIAANEVCTNQGFKSFITRNAVDPKFLYYWLRYQMPTIQSMGSGSTFLEISGSRAKEIPVHVAPIREQRRIVEKVEELFATVHAVCNRILRAAALVGLQVSRTSSSSAVVKSILAKAFAGELVPTEAELARRDGRIYEPASVLVERMRNERATSSSRGRHAP